MSRYHYDDYDGGWPSYVSAAERRLRAAREAQKLRKKGSPVEPVTIEGRRIASTFWGKAWSDNMESYRDFESRLPRGRSYARNGSVLDLQIAPGKITALVSGSSLYSVAIDITQLSKKKWGAIRADCAGGIDSLVELLQGKLSKAVMERLCRQDAGLFPKPSEIRFSCTCPDFASMCKHVAAALYGGGARLDRKPELLFRLRAGALLFGFAGRVAAFGFLSGGVGHAGGELRIPARAYGELRNALVEADRRMAHKVRIVRDGSRPPS